MAAATVADESEYARAARRQRFRRIGLIIAIVVALIIVGVIWHRHEASAAAAAAAKRAAATGISITSTTAETGDINVYLFAIGTVTPVFTDSITSQVNGPVMAVNFREGQLIKKGDSLIEIDPRPYRATLLQAQGILERDQNVLAQAEMDLKRYQAALARNAIAQQTVDDQGKLVLQDQGTVKNDQGTVQFDELQLQYCHITAPIDGKIGLRLVDPGNLVQANGSTALAVITQVQPITVIFTLSEDSLGPVVAQLRDGTRLAVDVFDRTAQTRLASGQLLALDNQIDTTTGTVKVRAIFDNKDNALFPNQFVNTRLLVNTVHGATLVDAAAVQQNGQSAYVYVIQNNVAHLRPVTVGVTDSGKTQVTGINPGDVLADSSFDKLQDNARVTVVEKPAAIKAATAGTPGNNNGTPTGPARAGSRPAGSSSGTGAP
ncbi:MAG: efflux RND transporter periplasmic adaptor subunit [Steroidobacteraceae bacterium]